MSVARPGLQALGLGARLRCFRDDGDHGEVHHRTSEARRAHRADAGTKLSDSQPGVSPKLVVDASRQSN